MSVFSSRPTGYKLGLVGLFLSTGLYLIGFSSPYWIKNDDAYLNQGLWMLCSSVLDTCVSLGVDVDGWYHLIRSFETVGLIVLLMTCLHSLIINWCISVPGPHSRRLEVYMFLGGLFSFTGALVFIDKVNDVMDVAQDSLKYSWALYLALTGSVFVLISSIIVGQSNKPPGGGGQTVAMGNVGGTRTAGSSVIVQTGTVQPQVPTAPVYHVPSAPLGGDIPLPVKFQYSAGAGYPVGSPSQAGYPPSYSEIYPPEASQGYRQLNF